MDLAIGAKDVYVMMTLFTKDGESKLVAECTYPLTGLACVSRVYTDYGVFATGPDGVRVAVHLRHHRRRSCETGCRWSCTADGRRRPVRRRPPRNPSEPRDSSSPWLVDWR